MKYIYIYLYKYIYTYLYTYVYIYFPYISSLNELNLTERNLSHSAPRPSPAPPTIPASISPYMTLLESYLLLSGVCGNLRSWGWFQRVGVEGKKFNLLFREDVGAVPSVILQKWKTIYITEHFLQKPARSQADIYTFFYI